MNVTKTDINGVLIIEPKIFCDDRGLFFESYSKKRYQEYGIDSEFTQDNISRSGKDVLRGLHYQTQNTQGKLVYMITGTVFDVIVDIRKNSSTFGQWRGFILDDKTHKQLYIPPGCAHGFCVLSDHVYLVYKCTDYYNPNAEKTIKWNDPTLNINWPVKNPIVSTKDTNGIYLQNAINDNLLL